MDPVDAEIAAFGLGGLDKLAPQPRPGGLRRHGLGAEDLEVAGLTRDQAATLEQVEQPTSTVDVVVSQVELGQAWVCLLYTSPSPRDRTRYRMPSSA